LSASPSLSRRDFFRKAAGAGTMQASEKLIANTPRDVAPAPSLAAHVANRLTFGPRPGDVAAIDAQGVDAWVNAQLNPTSSDTPELASALAALPTNTFAENTQTLYDRRIEYWMSVEPVNQVRHATMARMLHSKWQLRELMVEFWRDHFNVYGYDSPVSCLYPEWDRLLRQHCFGNFRAFVEATSKHPAMLYFLDNYLSTNAGPNENFARELCELHTLGAINYNVTGGYIDDDVYEASRCFTGWTYERDGKSPDRGKFKYVRDNHDRFQKVIFGTDIPRDQADLADGLKVLDLVCYHPGTARHLATKLLHRFVSENPSEALINSTADVFYQNRTDPNQIRLTLQHIFSSAEFRSTSNRMVLFKRPYDWIVSTMRALNIPYIYRDNDDDNDMDMTWMINQVGYQLFAWRSPKGPTFDRYTWCSANGMLRRYNFIFRIDAGWWDNKGLVYPSVSILPSSLKTTREICTWWVNRVIQRTVSNTTFENLMTFVSNGRNVDLALSTSQIEDKVPRLAALCTVTPEFMWR